MTAMHSITLINAADGTVHGHKAGCADVAREARKMFADQPWTFEVESKQQAWFSYNSDFLDECPDHDKCDESQAECSHAWDIDWKPCADHVPATAPQAEPVEVTPTCTYGGDCEDPAVVRVARTDSLHREEAQRIAYGCAEHHKPLTHNMAEYVSGWGDVTLTVERVR